MVITAKEFAQQTGFPVKLIRRLCRTGVLEHWTSGRVYLLDKDKAMAKMEMLKARPIYQPQQSRRRNVKKLPTEYLSIKDYFKAKMKAKEKTAGAATPTAK